MEWVFWISGGLLYFFFSAFVANRAGTWLYKRTYDLKCANVFLCIVLALMLMFGASAAWVLS